MMNFFVFQKEDKNERLKVPSMLSKGMWFQIFSMMIYILPDDFILLKSHMNIKWKGVPV